MTAAQTLAFPEENLVGWERALYAFLVEKQRRSGSLRTVQGYSSMLQHFFGRVGKAPDKVTVQEVFAWAHGKGVSGKDPSPVTIGARRRLGKQAVLRRVIRVTCTGHVYIRCACAPPHSPTGAFGASLG